MRDGRISPESAQKQARPKLLHIHLREKRKPAISIILLKTVKEQPHPLHHSDVAECELKVTGHAQVSSGKLNNIH